jgi:hypothetical protein
MSGIQKNVASQKFRVFAFDVTTNEPVTGDAANITCKVAKDWAAAGAVADTNPTETEDGFYLFDLTQAETNANVLDFYPESATADVQVVAVPGTVYTVPSGFQAGVQQTGDSYAIVNSGTHGNAALHTLLTSTGIKVLSFASGAITTAAFAAGALTDAVIATGAFTSAKFVDGFLTTAKLGASFFDGVWSVTTRQLTATGLDLIASTSTGFVAIATAVWTRVLAGNHDDAGSAGKILQDTAADAATAAGLTIPTPPTVEEIGDELETRTLPANVTEVNGAPVVIGDFRATGFATPTNVSDGTAEVIAALPSEPPTVEEIDTQLSLTHGDGSWEDAGGGGGSGDATQAKQDQIIATQALHTASLAALSVGAGTGPIAITVVTEPNALVSALKNGILSGWGYADENGEKVLQLTAGVHEFRSALVGFTGPAVSHNVTADAEVEVPLTALTIASSPVGSLTLYAEVLKVNSAGDGLEDAGAGVVLRLQVKNGPNGVAAPGTVLVATTGADSIAAFTGIPYGSRYEVWHGTATTKKKKGIAPTSGTDDTIPFIVGSA